MKASQIHNEFVTLLERNGLECGFSCQQWFGGSGRTSRNIVKLSGSVDCLVYFKVRSAEPYRWGVTANRLRELKQSRKKWVVVLLFESAETGYFLESGDVDNYMSIWPIASDGDYKVEPGTYLQYNKPFHSFSEFLAELMVD